MTTMDKTIDRLLERRGSGSYKWDANGRVFGKPDLLPFWVADMDFATPEPILAAVRERLAHPVLGYEERSDDYVECVQQWLAARHAWPVQRDWLMFCPPSTIVAMYGLIVTLTEAGNGIVVPTPTYGPLLDLVERNERQLLRCPMVEGESRFELDLDALEQAAASGAKMLILCSPHNPTGRVFDSDELATIAAIADRHGLIVVSDEVHADLVRPGHRHCPFGSTGLQRSATVISPNKTFNTAGLPQASLIIPDADMRARLQVFLDTLQVNHDSSFGGVAMIAAYRECGEWLDEVIGIIDRHHDELASYVAANVPGVKLWPAEATYLAWLDYRATGMDEIAVQRRLTERGGIALYNGSLFGDEGRGFLRMNIACPRETLEQGLAGLAKAFA